MIFTVISRRTLAARFFVTFRNLSSSQLSHNGCEQRHLLFFGSDSFSIGVFRELLSQYRPNLTAIDACVVSRHVLFAKYLATYHPEIPTYVWPNLPPAKPDESNKIALVASFGKLIPETFISRLPNRILNIHPSLLPRWRGAAPLPRSIMAGDLVVGVSVVQVAPRHFDVGKVLAQQEVVPNCEMRVDQLSETLATTGVSLMVQKVLPDLGKSMSQAIDQNTLPYQACLAKRLKHSDLSVNWSNMTAAEITRLFAATLATDHHHQNVTGQLRTYFDGHPVRLIQIDPMPALDSEDGIIAPPGRIIFDSVGKDRLSIKSKRGWVVVRRLIYKKPMSASDFYNGYLSKVPDSAHFFENSS